MAEDGVTDAQLVELVATSAFIGGDIRRYVALVNHADDDTQGRRLPS